MIVCYEPRTDTGCGAINPNGTPYCQNCGSSLRYCLELYDPDTLIGSYRIARLIGRGGFGAIYEAHPLDEPQQRVAIKVAISPAYTKGYQEEFNILHRLHHPNLPTYEEMFVLDDCAHLVLELLEGQTMEDIINRAEGPLPESQVLSYAFALCDVLEYLHTQQPPIFHRDIKPSNIRLARDGTVKLIDFGLLKHGMGATLSYRRGFTRDYAPIEQWGEGLGTDLRSDIYSLGATLYHMLTGQEPTPSPVRSSKTPDPLPHPRHLNPTLTPHVADAVMKAMGLLPQQRFETAALFRQALQGKASTSLSIPATPDKMGVERTLEGHTDAVSALVYSIDGRVLISASADGSARVWDASDGTLLQMYQDQDSSGLTSIALTRDGSMLALGGTDDVVRLVRVRDMSLVQRMELHTGWVLSVAFSPDGSLVASGGADGQIHLWRVSDGALLRSFTGHTDDVTGVAFNPEGTMIASSGAYRDKSVRLWNVEDGALYCSLEGHQNIVTSVAWSPRGRTVASSGGRRDDTVRLWWVADGMLRYTLYGHTSDVLSVIWRPDGTQLASAGADQTIRLWNTDDGDLAAVLQGHSGTIQALAWHPQGNQLASAGTDRAIHIWRV